MSMFSELRRDPRLRDLLLTQITTFIRVLSVLKNDIILGQSASIIPDAAPPSLPLSIHTFVSDATGVPFESVPNLWNLVKEDIWVIHDSDTKLSTSEEELFRMHGWKLGLASLTLYPPSHCCPDCPGTGALKKAETRQAIVYTQASGAVPAWAVHLYCPNCNTNYHHNFSVQAGMRTYYGNKPTYIQISEHQFAERKLVGLWVSLMLVAWVSATNCARSYDMALSQQQERDFAAGGWQFGCVLTPDHIWDAFIILTLLDYNDRKHTCLHVPHTGEQKNRFKDAMRAHNHEVIKEGQDAIDHCCDKCLRVWTRPDGTEQDVQPAIGDGLAMGNRCCQTAHCTLDLDNNRHRFCPLHAHLDRICSIVGCDATVVPGKKSCAAQAHIEMERLHYERGRAAFTLRDRLQKHRLAHPHDGAHLWSIQKMMTKEKNDINSGSIGLDDSVPCEATKSDTGNQNFKAIFGGSHTHNEQILVRPCRVIVSRATFYNAEAVSNVLLFVQKTFSVPRAFKPEHFIYNTNCNAKQQVLARPEEWSWFLDVGMTVNVFHFLHKHKVGHEFCQEHCNPADHPELMGPDGRTWFFNTSIAEQTNVWLGGYHSICREMLPAKYNFFLDEMIRLRNELTVAKLAADGQNPRRRVDRATSF
ncbi:hypothetical protein DFH08DRAFT_691424 [Mycena albidolilacea]|uniref:CxC5 like cysteine cluster associated with KDZ domain-containing protein n=1 Tax=Mycena albidolilacea TaxID=1033008 RepID=A0AAD7EWN6_9AGAR|nr:hypothetical protein DFH08DRAFT_691424 [Mycena albidolilacea]